MIKPDLTTRSSNKEQQMKISELARKAGCPVETIRYYEKQGLLSKPQRNLENNYRCYDIVHLERLLFIRRCRALDMAQDEIRALLRAMKTKNISCDPIETIVKKHLEHVQHRIKELQFLEIELNELQGVCDSTSSVLECRILEKLNSSQGNDAIPTLINNKHLGGVH